MTWFQLTSKEWRRRPLRTGITAAGVAVSVAALFSLFSFQHGYREGVQRELDRLGAHVLVVPKGCPYDAASIALHGASWPCYLKAEYLEEVRATAGVATAAPALMSAFYDSNGHQTVYVGIDAQMLRLKRSWTVRGAFPSQPGEILAGSAAAQRFNWRLGDHVRLPQLPQASGRVAGILAPTSGADDAFIFLRLEDAQSLWHRPGQLTHILVRLADPTELDPVVSRLRGCDAGMHMNVVPLAHLFRTLQSVVSSTRLLLGCIALVALMGAGAGVSNTVLMAVAERTPEIGLLRALGASRWQVFRLFWLETLQLCLAGAAVGVLGAFAVSRAVEGWLRSELPFAPAETLIRWEGWNLLFCVGAALVLGSLACLVPAGRAAFLTPVGAIRKQETLA